MLDGDDPFNSDIVVSKLAADNPAVVLIYIDFSDFSDMFALFRQYLAPDKGDSAFNQFNAESPLSGARY